MTPDRIATLRFFAEPGDVNFLGKAFGGAVMKWIDLCGYAVAAGWCGTSCVTVYVGGIRFHKPIQIGHLVELTGKLIHTGRSSMHIAVDVRSKNPRGGEWLKTTTCLIVFAAIDDAGQPVSVPAWTALTDEDKALQNYAIRMQEAAKRDDR